MTETPALDAVALGRWMDAECLPGEGAPTLSRLSGGSQNELFLVERDGVKAVLRIPVRRPVHPRAVRQTGRVPVSLESFPCRRAKEEPPVSGKDVASLALRAAIGGTMIAHGVRHGRSLDGTARWFGSIGFRQPRIQAAASAAVEVGAGVALVAGAATPLAASAVIGTMAVAARSVHLPNGFFITGEGYEYVLNLSAASVALAAIGPGSLSVDHLLGLDAKLTGRQRAALAAGLGLAAAVAQLAVFWERPKAEPPAAEESSGSGQ
jgi:putative oxidoreductase